MKIFKKLGFEVEDGSIDEGSRGDEEIMMG